MTLINERNGPHLNSESVFTIAITDTNEHDLPDVNGDDSAGGDPYTIEGADQAVTKIVNGADQDATVRLEATTFDDPGFSEPVTLQSGVTVSASGGTASINVGSDIPYAYLRVIASYATAPTSGETKVVYQSDE